uniref:C2H2-type domain-containing protein n=1 Tax=Meloidogyne incognita TaxID=6306 RepID=A0A914LBW9_MELIC
MSRIHKCDVCGKRFKKRGDLIQHNRIHTNDRPYVCHYCPKRFKQKSHVEQHERIHTGSKPFACQFCGQEFRQISQQLVHEATYHGENQREVEAPITPLSASRPRVPQQTSTQSTPRTSVVYPKTTRRAVASAVVQPSTSSRGHDPPKKSRRLPQTEKRRSPTRFIPMPQVPQTAPNLNLNKNSSRIQKFESSPPPSRRRERQRSVPTPIVQKIVVRRFELSPSPSNKLQSERLPPMDNNVIRQQEVTTQSPHSKQQRQPPQLLSNPTIQQNDVGGQQQESQQNNGEILKFIQTIYDQNALVKDINHHYQIVVPEKMRNIREITEKLAKFAEAVKTRI